MKQALWANRWLLLLAAELLIIALWLSLAADQAQAQTGGRCVFGYIRYWQNGYYITEGRWFCTGWQRPRYLYGGR